MTGNNTNPQLAEVLRQHHPLDGPFTCTWSCSCGADFHDFSDHADHVAAVWRDACRIETVEQLNALPQGSWVLDNDGDALKKRDGRDGPGWYCSTDHGFSDPVTLPATLLWLPEWQEEQR